METCWHLFIVSFLCVWNKLQFGTSLFCKSVCVLKRLLELCLGLVEQRITRSRNEGSYFFLSQVVGVKEIFLSIINHIYICQCIFLHCSHCFKKAISDKYFFFFDFFLLNIFDNGLKILQNTRTELHSGCPSKQFAVVH